MGLWILECDGGEHVPGTSKLVATSNNDGDVQSSDGAEKKAFILDPVPTDDPNDPLNWPLWQRDAVLIILCYATFLTTSSGSVLSNSFVVLSTYFGRGFGDIANLTAYWQCALAVAGGFVVPFAKIWGKRHQYLLGLLLVLVGCIWTAQSKSYASFLWSRIVQGLGTAVFEALLGVSVGDLYHVHERGTRMSLVAILGFAAGFMSPVLSGLVLEHLGWQWIFYIVAILTGIGLLATFLFVPETTFHRNYEVFAALQVNSIDSMEQPTQRMSFTQRLWPTQGRISNENFGILLVRPFVLLLHPAVLWFALFSGTSISWVIFTIVVMGITFPGPPLNFSPSQIGLMNFSAWVGSLIGFIICALVSDRSAKWLAKRNNGVYEPEFRLVLVIPSAVIGFVGLYGFGVAVADLEKYGWFWCAFFYALQVVSMVIATMVGSAYIVDGYGPIAVEAFIIFMIFKNMFGFALASPAVTWIAEAGILRIFTIIASVQLAIALTSVPLYIYGKRIRAKFSKISFLSAAE